MTVAPGMERLRSTAYSVVRRSRYVPGKRQALSACLNVGDCGLSASGITMNDPGRPNAIAKPAGFAGGELTGSGKPGRPCARMHRERSSIVSFCCPVAAARSPGPPGISDRQARWAVWNAGAAGLMSFGIWSPPPLPGSGKLGTPFARMHAAYLIPLERAAELDGLCELPDDPQAVIARTPAAAARAMQALLLMARRGIQDPR
jgi:hypothetical protein